MSSENFSEQKFLNIIDQTPLVSIDLIIENPEGKILLGMRNNKPAQNYWFVPGGRIRKNETLEQAMKRISKTELGFEIDINDTELIGAYDHIYTDNFANAKDINTHYVALGHRYKLKNEIPITIDNQHNKILWLNIRDLLNRDDVHQNTRAYFINGNKVYNQQ
ncbi:MAG: GDP-mannose mannosyl hydrolase [Gammaproteobacteria bacterium]|nr:GDP-mannose mannosyl hydrolase [Gammaproteobacteria bacterium]